MLTLVLRFSILMHEKAVLALYIFANSNLFFLTEFLLKTHILCNPINMSMKENNNVTYIKLKSISFTACTVLNT